MLLNLLDIKASELHGGLTQTQVKNQYALFTFIPLKKNFFYFFVKRLDKLESFKKCELNVMVATDLAARGLDIAGVKTVINFSMPLTYKQYIHRVGRTARAKNSGRSISLVTESDRWLVKEIVKASREPVKCRLIPADVIEHYREKVENIRGQLVAQLKDEQSEKLIDQMERDVRDFLLFLR